MTTWQIIFLIIFQFVVGVSVGYCLGCISVYREKKQVTKPQYTIPMTPEILDMLYPPTTHAQPKEQRVCKGFGNH